MRVVSVAIRELVVFLLYNDRHKGSAWPVSKVNGKCTYVFVRLAAADLVSVIDKQGLCRYYVYMLLD